MDVDKKWFFSDRGKRFGPITISAMNELISSGEIVNDTLVWQEGFDDWQEASKCSVFKSFFLHSDTLDSIEEESPIDENPTFDSLDSIPDGISKEVKGNYFSRHWKGDNSLPFSYWVNGVIFNVMMVAGFKALEEEFTFEFQIWLVFIAVAILFSLWSITGIWRSAGHYIRDAHRENSKKSSIWGYISRIVIVIGVLQNIPIFNDLVSLYLIEKSDISTQYSIEYAGSTDVVLTGYINERSVKAIKDIFINDSERNALLLDSPGGFLSAAFELADFVESKDIFTVVRDECASACLLVLASSKISAASSNARLAFHHPQSTAEFTSSELIAEGNRSEDEYYSRFLRYGVPSKKLDKYRASGWTDLSLGEASDDKFIDFIWDELSNEFLDPEQLCIEIDCYAIPLVIPNKSNLEASLSKLNPQETVIQSDNELELMLFELSLQINEQMGLPIMIDADTRLERTEYLGGEFTYFYTLVNFSSEDLSREEFEMAMTPELLNLVCLSDEMSFFVDSAVPVSYSYNGKDENIFSIITITTSGCENLKK